MRQIVAGRAAPAAAGRRRRPAAPGAAATSAAPTDGGGAAGAPAPNPATDVGDACAYDPVGGAGGAGRRASRRPRTAEPPAQPVLRSRRRKAPNPTTSSPTAATDQPAGRRGRPRLDRHQRRPGERGQVVDPVRPVQRPGEHGDDHDVGDHRPRHGGRRPGKDAHGRHGDPGDAPRRPARRPATRRTAGRTSRRRRSTPPGPGRSPAPETTPAAADPTRATVTWLPSHAVRLVAVASTGSARPVDSSVRARSTEETA